VVSSLTVTRAARTSRRRITASLLRILDFMLPYIEKKAMAQAVQEAATSATEGHVEEGYTILLAGLRHAVESSRAGKLWGHQLLDRYQRALTQYAAQYDSIAPR
jgi:hypothetical protein